MRKIILVVATIFAGLMISVNVNADQFPNASPFNSSAESSTETELNIDTNNGRTSHHYEIPQNTPVPLEGIRWPSQRVTICLQTDDPKIRQAFQDAVKRWNATKAIHFVWIKDPKQAQVVAQNGDLSDNTHPATVGYVTSQLGSTETKFNPDTNTLIKATSTLDPTQLDYTNRQFRSEVAQHELGHSIGLAHAPTYEHSVMISRNIRTGITKNDVESVRMLYHHD